MSYDSEDAVRDLLMLAKQLRYCPKHGIPDCSPIYNGCFLPIHNQNALDRLWDYITKLEGMSPQQRVLQYDND